MKVGDIVKFPPLLALDDEDVECMIVSMDENAAKGRLTFHGVWLGNATLSINGDGSWEVVNVEN